MTKQQIKKIRLARGLDQKEFGEYLGVSAAAVSQWETGARSPRPSKIKKILEYCEKNKIKV